MSSTIPAVTDEQFRVWLERLETEVDRDISGTFLWEPDLKRLFEAIWIDGYNRGCEAR